MKVLSRALNTIDNISDKTGKVVGFLVLALMGVLCCEVFLRGLFNAPTLWVHEGSQYIYSAHFMLGGAYCLRWSGMVNVDIIIDRLRPRTRAITEIITTLVIFTFLGVLILKGINMSIWSVKILETSQSPWGPPIYPLKIMIPVAAMLMFFQVLAKFIRNIVLAVTGSELK